jgi:alkaline phosphatase
LTKFVTDTQNTNILIVTAAHRHGLQESSCVNKETELHNRKLQKIMKIKENVNVIQSKLSRNDFTRHGMHLKLLAKKKLLSLWDRP